VEKTTRGGKKRGGRSRRSREEHGSGDGRERWLSGQGDHREGREARSQLGSGAQPRRRSSSRSGGLRLRRCLAAERDRHRGPWLVESRKGYNLQKCQREEERESTRGGKKGSAEMGSFIGEGRL
jgi:hypothetical protein